MVQPFPADDDDENTVASEQSNVLLEEEAQFVLPQIIQQQDEGQSEEEDIAAVSRGGKYLARAWINVSEDGCKGKDQKGKDFWDAVTKKFNRWSNSLRTTKSLMSRWISVRQSAKAMIAIDRRTLYESGTCKKMHEAKLFKLFNEFVAEKKRTTPSSKMQKMKSADMEVYMALYLQFLANKTKFSNPAENPNIKRPAKGARALKSAKKAKTKARMAMKDLGVLPMGTIDDDDDDDDDGADDDGGKKPAARSNTASPSPVQEFIAGMSQQHSVIANAITAQANQQAQANQFNQQMMTAALGAAIQYFTGAPFVPPVVGGPTMAASTAASTAASSDSAPGVLDGRGSDESEDAVQDSAGVGRI